MMGNPLLADRRTRAVRRTDSEASRPLGRPTRMRWSLRTRRCPGARRCAVNWCGAVAEAREPAAALIADQPGRDRRVERTCRPQGHLDPPPGQAPRRGVPAQPPAPDLPGRAAASPPGSVLWPAGARPRYSRSGSIIRRAAVELAEQRARSSVRPRERSSRGTRLRRRG